MKKALLFLCFVLLFFTATIGRYQPVSLDLVQPTTMEVEVKGEVKNPGIYTIQWKGKVKDAIACAGGLTEEADCSNLSMVRVCNPDEVIVIGKKQKESKPKISINTASQEQLMELTGIGEAISQRIIEYREKTPFQSLEDLMQVKGIGEKMFAKIKDQITL